MWDKIETTCPFCERFFPADKMICSCGAYRVTKETYNLPFSKQPFNKMKKK